jgi:hypothetical protein
VTWYAASLIYVFKLRTGKQKRFSVWEDVCLVKASSGAVARRKAERLGRSREDKDQTWTVGGRPGRPATLVFAGVRKVLTIANPISAPSLDTDPPRHGTEVTFSTFTLKSKKDLDKLVSGQSVPMIYEED